MGNQGDVQVAHAIMTDANGFPAAVFRIAKGAIRASVIAAEVAGHINRSLQKINRSLQKIRCGPELSQMMVVGFAKGILPLPAAIVVPGRWSFLERATGIEPSDLELGMLLALATELRPPRISMSLGGAPRSHPPVK